MDALEFLKERRRMCSSYEHCENCPLEESNCTVSDLVDSDEDYKRVIAAVEQWSKEHPAKTRLTPEEFAEYLYELPATDVAPVVHARWVSFLDGDHIMPERYYRCSRCGRVESRRQPYCHCGAKMDG